MELPASLYVPTDGGSPVATGYEATALTIGPWDPGLQHAGPPAALLLREAERAGGIDGGQTVRLAYDIFAPVPVGPVQVSATVVRPGRRIELVEAVLSAGDARPLMRLSAWRMRTRADGAAEDRPEPHPAAAGWQDSRPETAAFSPRRSPTTGRWSGGSPPAASTPPGRRRPGRGRSASSWPARR